MALLDGDGGQAKEVGAQRSQVEHGHALRGGAQPLVGANRYPAKDPPAGDLLVVADIDQVPVLPVCIAEDKERVGMVGEQLIDG